MADPAGDVGNAAVQELFAHLRSRPQQSPRSDAGSANAFAVSSPTPSRSATNPMQAPVYASAPQGLTPFSPVTNIASPGADQPGQDRTAPLLNLLKFNTGAHSSNTQVQSPSTSARASLLHSPGSQQQFRGISTSDLVSSFMGRSNVPENPTPSPPAETSAANLGGLSNHQDALLQLLNRQTGGVSSSQPSQAGELRSHIPVAGRASTSPLPGAEAVSAQLQPTVSTNVTPRANSLSRDSPIRVFGSHDSREPTPFEPQDMPKPATNTPSRAAEKGIFTYVNPFDQLAASSPRNKTPAALPSTNGAPLTVNSHAAPAHKTNPSGSLEVASPKPLAVGRTRVEALMGIGAPSNDVEVVSDALDNVGEQVEKQAAYRPADTDESHVSKKIKREPSPPEDLVESIEKEIDQAATDIKHELDTEEVREALGKLVTGNADVVQDMIDEAAAADDEESLGSADALPEVPVYSIPPKPFVGIQLNQPDMPDLLFRDSCITDIARVRKEFDQIDRNLVTASNNYIIYATPKKGHGIRVIRQSDGRDCQLFKENDPIFNVAVSSTPPGKAEHGVETCIATGISGTVYWASLRFDESEMSQDEDISKHFLVFPPSPAQDDNTSGGQLKTRAKTSNRHPEFFAIGRGKTIQIIFPSHALTSKHIKNQFTVDTDAYFKDRSLKINTGKAGKDFTFSEDDTVLASLDKAGRLRFWDIRDLTDENNSTASKLAPLEVNQAIMTVSTAHVTDKAWPTSVLFVDKLRPYVRGSALRYVIVGMKQNHTLQLWDVGLGKVVQELSLPHENESDAICSVVYHPGTGIIVVGHPTRNSIYFIHLSAPKYNLQGLSQAKYLAAIIAKNPSLPKPESTAIMSGIREYSFASKGQIRSLDLLSSQNTSAEKRNDDDKGQFELYVMHSKGVTCLNIRKFDLGWSHDNKVVTKIDGEQSGVIVVKELQELRPIADSEISSVNGDAVGTTKGLSSGARSPLPELAISKEKENVPVGEPKSNGTPSASKSEKRKKKRSEPTSEEVVDNVPPPAPVPPTASYASATVRNAPSTPSKVAKTPKKELTEEPASESRQLALTNTDASPMSATVSSDFIEREYKRIEDGMKVAFSQSLATELEVVRRRIDEDRRVQDAAGESRQEAILKLVSSSLTENIDKALDRIVASNIQKHVVPAISQSTEKIVKKAVTEWLHNNLQQPFSNQLKTALPEAIGNAMSSQQFLATLTDGVTNKLSKRLDREMQSNVFPQFQKLAVSAATSLAAETERRVAEQLKVADIKAQDNSAKIDKLTFLAEDLFNTVRTMAENQSGMRSEILTLHEEIQRLRSEPAQALTTTTSANQTLVDPELQAIVTMMDEGRYEEGTIQWLQSPNQSTLFNTFFVKIDPSYLQQCPGLVTLSVGAAVSTNMEHHITERLHWLGAVLGYIDPSDPEVKAIAPQIMDVIVQRLESRYMSLAEVDPTDANLRRIPMLTKAAKEIKVLAQQRATE